MRLGIWIVSGALAVGTCGCDATLGHHDLASSPAPTEFSNAVNPYLQTMASANDPSEVIAAYARGLAVAPDSIALQRAYVHSMVELGVPHAAAAQARRLTQADPDDALGWAVTAFADAQAGRIEGAFENLLTAIPRAPNNPFVVSVAAQLVAWGDQTPAPAGLTPGITSMATRVRQAYDGHEAFQAAVENAAAALARGAGAPAGR